MLPRQVHGPRCPRLAPPFAVLVIGLWALSAGRAAATVANDVCAGDPCIVNVTANVTPGSTLDFGTRALIIAPTGKLAVTSVGGLTIYAASIELQGGGKISNPGGAVAIQVTGGVQLASSAMIDVSAPDGGSIELIAGGSAKLDGSLSANGTGYGGFVAVMADNISVASGISVKGGSGDAGSIELIGVLGNSINASLNASSASGAGGSIALQSLTGSVTVSQTLNVGGLGGGDVFVEAAGTVLLFGAIAGSGGSADFVGFDAGQVDVQAAQDVTIQAPITLNGGPPDGRGGDLSVAASGQITIATTIHADANGQFGVGGSVDLQGCGVDVSAGATVTVNGGNGTNQIQASGQLTVAGTMTATSGQNVIRYRSPGMPPSVTGSVSPVPQIVLDPALPACAEIVVTTTTTSTSSSTVTTTSTTSTINSTTSSSSTSSSTTAAPTTSTSSTTKVTTTTTSSSSTSSSVSPTTSTSSTTTPTTSSTAPPTTSTSSMISSTSSTSSSTTSSAPTTSSIVPTTQPTTSSTSTSSTPETTSSSTTTSATSSTTSSTVPVCGNGIKEGDEECDDGTMNGRVASCCREGCVAKPARVPCGDADPLGECDQGDQCDTRGVCQKRHLAQGSPCEDDGLVCTEDVCDENLGTCTHPPRARLTPCGDTLGSDCDLLDFCDGASPTCPTGNGAGQACSSDVQPVDGDAIEVGCEATDITQGTLSASCDAVGFKAVSATRSLATRRKAVALCKLPVLPDVTSTRDGKQVTRKFKNQGIAQGTRKTLRLTLNKRGKNLLTRDGCLVVAVKVRVKQGDAHVDVRRLISLRR
jgi:hypothetical protein